MLWSGILFQEIVDVNDRQSFYKTQIRQSATLQHHFLS